MSPPSACAAVTALRASGPTWSPFGCATTKVDICDAKIGVSERHCGLAGVENGCRNTHVEGFAVAAHVGQGNGELR